MTLLVVILVLVLGLVGVAYLLGRKAPVVAQQKHNLKVKDEQLKAATDRPLTPSELADRVRDGKF